MENGKTKDWQQKEPCFTVQGSTHRSLCEGSEQMLNVRDLAKQPLLRRYSSGLVEPGTPSTESKAGALCSGLRAELDMEVSPPSPEQCLC